MRNIDLETDEDLDNHAESLSNWGRWGVDDQLGTLNYITNEIKLNASKLIQTGKTISLARETDIQTLRDNTSLLFPNKDEIFDLLVGDQGCAEFIGSSIHGFNITHLDSLCHFFKNKDEMYNGFSTKELIKDGAGKLAMENVANEGIVGRGVLLDMPLVKGKSLAPGMNFFPEDLSKAEETCKVEVKSGDILFIRTGAGRKNTREIRSGLHPNCLPWLHQKEIAVLGSDGASDTNPSSFERWNLPIYMIAIPYMGLHLLDNAELDLLSRTCQEENRWEFMVIIAPWRYKGTTSSPVNPLVIF
ncbi:MAG: cyclase family protein [Candidatus Heimdallarchaeota archaeon]|nr:cyclase family protein [Candidatus Heimdallarchaeota archaeon]